MRIDNDLIPYACYADEYSILTKNDCVLQTVTFNTNLDNQDSFREQIRQFISENYSPEVAIYLHTIKISSEDETQAKAPERFENIIIQEIGNICKFTSNYEISYNITFVTKILPEKKNNSVFSISSGAFYNMHKVYKKRAIGKLSKITNALMDSFKEYNPVKLGIKQEQSGHYISQHMNFLGKLINLTDEIFNLPISGLCQATNHSDYKFGKNKLLAKGVKNRYAKIFTIKEYSEISSATIYRLLQGVSDIIISQVLIPVNNTLLLKEYKKLAEIHKASNDKSFQESSNLKYMNTLIETGGEINIYSKSQLNVMIMGNSTSELNQNAKVMTEVFSKSGILAFSEDVHLQNVFFSMIPGNFRFLARLNNVPTSLSGGFAYAQGSERMENNNVMWRKTLFTLQKTNNRRYEFGMPTEQRNVFITGPKACGRTLLGNLISLGAIRHDINVLYIDVGHESDVCSVLSGMSLVNVSSGKVNDISLKLNPFADLKLTKTDLGYAINLLKLMLGGKYDKSMSADLKDLAIKIIRSNGVGMQKFLHSSPLREFFIDWIQVGKFGNVFNEISDIDPISVGKSTRVVLDEADIQNETLVSSVALALLYKISKIIDSKKNYLILIKDVFSIFKSNFSAKILEQIFTKARESSRVSFVITNISDISQINSSKTKDIILKHSEHKIHFGDERIGNVSEYKECFSLSAKDVDNIITIDRQYGRSFIVFTPYSATGVKFNLSALEDNLRIMSDGSGKAMQILQNIINDGEADRNQMYKDLLYEINNYTSVNDEYEDPEDNPEQDILDAA